jgi:hypothetical protein
MSKLFGFFMLSSVFSVAYAMENSKEVQKVYPYWVQNAVLIKVYNHEGDLRMSVPITHGATVYDVRQYLHDERVIKNLFQCSLHPLYNGWWRFGYWDFSHKKVSSGNIKDYMERYGTASFWIKKVEGE